MRRSRCEDRGRSDLKSNGRRPPQVPRLRSMTTERGREVIRKRSRVSRRPSPPSLTSDVDTGLRLSPPHCALTTTHTWPHGRFALLCCPGVTKHSQSPTNQPNPKRGVKKQTRSPSWILARNEYCLLYPWLLVVLSSLFPFLVASDCLLLIRGSSSAAESSSLLTRFLRIPFVSRPSFPSSDLEDHLGPAPPAPLPCSSSRS